MQRSCPYSGKSRGSACPWYDGRASPGKTTCLIPASPLPGKCDSLRLRPTPVSPPFHRTHRLTRLGAPQHPRRPLLSQASSPSTRRFRIGWTQQRCYLLSPANSNTQNPTAMLPGLHQTSPVRDVKGFASVPNPTPSPCPPAPLPTWISVLVFLLLLLQSPFPLCPSPLLPGFLPHLPSLLCLLNWLPLLLPLPAAMAPQTLHNPPTPPSPGKAVPAREKHEGGLSNSPRRADTTLSLALSSSLSLSLRTLVGGHRVPWLHLYSSNQSPQPPPGLDTAGGRGGPKVRNPWALGLTPAHNTSHAEHIPGPASSPGGLLGQGGAPPRGRAGRRPRIPLLRAEPKGTTASAPLDQAQSSQQGVSGVPGSPLCHRLPSLHRLGLPPGGDFCSHVGLWRENSQVWKTKQTTLKRFGQLYGHGWSALGF